MRAVLSVDIDLAARALLRLPAPERPAAMRALCERAHMADLWRRRTGRAHPDWGDGTLAAAALAGALAPARPRYDPVWTDILRTALTGLDDWRQVPARRSDRHSKS